MLLKMGQTVGSAINIKYSTNRMSFVNLKHRESHWSTKYLKSNKMLINFLRHSFILINQIWTFSSGQHIRNREMWCEINENQENIPKNGAVGRISYKIENNVLLILMIFMNPECRESHWSKEYLKTIKKFSKMRQLIIHKNVNHKFHFS